MAKYYLNRESSPDFRFLIAIRSGILKAKSEITESDFGDYLPNLEDYEDRLARGEIKW